MREADIAGELLPEGEGDDDDWDVVKECSKRHDASEVHSYWHTLTHLPNSVHCPVCRRAKAQRVASTRRKPDDARRPLRVGDEITVDRFITNSELSTGLHC